MKHVPPIIDIEASGFGNASYPIEIGFVTSIGERFCRLIRPADDWLFWDKKAEAVHHISRPSLNKYGYKIEAVAEELNILLAGQTLYSDGWVVDKPWINTLFERARIRMLFSISPIELILREEQMDIWDATKQEVIKDLNLTRHRASNDAVIIQETFRRTTEFIRPKVIEEAFSNARSDRH